MVGEPWCFTVREVGRMTDWQIWELYINPAVKRAKKLDRRRRGGLGLPDRKGGKRRLPTKEEYIMLAPTFGYTKEQAEVEYDKVIANGSGGE